MLAILGSFHTNDLKNRNCKIYSTKWKNRVKGRDWYDLEWYIRKGIPIDLRHFKLRAKGTGDWSKEELSLDDVIGLLREKIKAVSFDNIREDVLPFIKDDAVLEIWGEQYFNDLVDKLNPNK